MNKLKGKEFFIFDMDGCLIDSEKYYQKAWEETFIKNNVDIRLSTIEKWTGLGKHLINAEIYAVVKDDKQVDKLRAEREEVFFQHLHNGDITIKPGAIDYLNQLKSEKKTLGLATSTYRLKAKKLISHFKLEAYFDYFAFGDDVTTTKPSPDIFLKILSSSGYKAKESIIFEDSKNGVIAAHRAGIDCVYIPDIVDYDLADDYYILKLKSFKDLLI